MRRYSKGPEHDYSPQLRDQVLAQSRQQNRAAIASGLGWLDEAAKRHSLIARCLQIAA